MTTIQTTAFAKINLFLHVTGKRPDGYHLLDSWVVFASAADRIELTTADKMSFTAKGPFATNVPSENSLTKAATMLAKRFNLQPSVNISLDKQLPVAAGIGGGSADAAATLRGLAQLWKLSPSEQELSEMALSIGADVPACLASTSLYMNGIGEEITPGPALPKFYGVLVNPGVAVDTAKVFKAYRGVFSQKTSHPSSFADAATMFNYLSLTRNDLQEPAIAIAPAIAQVIVMLANQTGCKTARMSGSGATCFALFADEYDADTCAANIAGERPDWWTRKVTFQ